MTFNFPLILMSVVLFSGVVTLVDLIYCLCNKENFFEKKKRPIIIEYTRSFFPVLLLVFFIRTFLAQPYRVPTGSLEPTVLPGDLLLVNQFSYGLRMPLWNTKLVSINEPAYGQIALFYYPTDPHITFVKRIVGLPGDHISYIDRTLYINGKAQPQKYIGDVTRINDFGQLVTYQKYEENLEGVKHNIFIRTDVQKNNFYNVIVPSDAYFAMGDNRDESADSRYFGFVPEKDFIGKAMLVWLSLDSNASHWYDYIRFDRIGKKL